MRFLFLKSGTYLIGDGGVIGAVPVDERYVDASSVYKSHLLLAGNKQNIPVEETMEELNALFGGIITYTV